MSPNIGRAQTYGPCTLRDSRWKSTVHNFKDNLGRLSGNENMEVIPRELLLNQQGK